MRHSNIKNLRFEAFKGQCDFKAEIVFLPRLALLVARNIFFQNK